MSSQGTTQDGTTEPPSTPKRTEASGEDTSQNTATAAVPKNKVNTRDKNSQVQIKSDTFVTFHAETGKYQSRFKIIPYSRTMSSKYSAGADKLSQCILKGGGVVQVQNDSEELCESEGPNDVIKILDVEFIRANIQKTQDMMLPYDCFSSSFIWNQIYQRSLSDHEKRNADLNCFRVSPSAHVVHDANLILRGSITWDDVQPISTEQLKPAIRVKEVALQIFPELVLFAGRFRVSQLGKTRRLYTKKEGQMLLDKVCEENGHCRVQGISMYKDLAERFFPNRSGPSLKEHFRKTILPRVLANDGYFTVALEDILTFQNIAQTKGQKQVRKRKLRNEENENDEEYFTP